MKKELDALVERMEIAYHEEVDDICQSAGADMPLTGISYSKLLRIRRYLEENYNIRYWIDKIKFNPTRKYTLWIEKVKGSDPVWGISPVTAE